MKYVHQVEGRRKKTTKNLIKDAKSEREQKYTLESVFLTFYFFSPACREIKFCIIEGGYNIKREERINASRFR